jgi:pimeloyl-ACP methyl ester carboxylesterase
MTASAAPPAARFQERPLPEVPGVRHSDHQVRGVRLHVAEAGAGPPLVLLHGWPQHWYEWRDLIPPLSERYRVLCPDLRGFGWSEAPPDGYEKENLMRDMLALLDELGVERFRLAGHDWGGWIGFLICLLAPDRVERFLALNVAHPFSRPTLSVSASLWRFWYQLVISAPMLGERAVRTLARTDNPLLSWLGARPSAWSDEEARAFLHQFAEPARARASVLLYRSFVTREMPQMVAGRYRRTRLRTPTLLLHGLDDQVIRPVHFADHERYADDMSVELVPGCGHFIVDERPELVLERALAFFR